MTRSSKILLLWCEVVLFASYLLQVTTSSTFSALADCRQDQRTSSQSERAEGPLRRQFGRGCATMSGGFPTRCGFVLLRWPWVFLVGVRPIFELMLDGELMETSSAYLVHCFFCRLIFFFNLLCKIVFFSSPCIIFFCGVNESFIPKV